MGASANICDVCKFFFELNITMKMKFEFNFHRYWATIADLINCLNWTVSAGPIGLK